LQERERVSPGRVREGMLGERKLRKVQGKKVKRDQILQR